MHVFETESAIQGEGRRLRGDYFELDGADAFPACLVTDASEQRARDRISIRVSIW